MADKVHARVRAHALIFGEDQAKPEDACVGPIGAGRCPRVEPGSPVACAGKSIVPTPVTRTAGWRLHVAPDAKSCPLASLGAGRYR